MEFAFPFTRIMSSWSKANVQLLWLQQMEEWEDFSLVPGGWGDWKHTKMSSINKSRSGDHHRRAKIRTFAAKWWGLSERALSYILKISLPATYFLRQPDISALPIRGRLHSWTRDWGHQSRGQLSWGDTSGWMSLGLTDSLKHLRLTLCLPSIFNWRIIKSDYWLVFGEGFLSLWHRKLFLLLDVLQYSGLYNRAVIGSDLHSALQNVSSAASILHEQSMDQTLPFEGAVLPLRSYH